MIEEVNNYASFLKGYHRELNAVLGELSDNGKIVSMPSVIKSFFFYRFRNNICVIFRLLLMSLPSVMILKFKKLLLASLSIDN